MRLISLLFPLLVLAHNSLSQTLPAEGSMLHCRLIGFSFFPCEQNISTYKLEIASGKQLTEGGFQKNIIKTISSSQSKIIAEVPSFGSEYTWRVIHSSSNSQHAEDSLHHFSTRQLPQIDTPNFRLRVIKPAVKYNDAYVFLDDNKALYDLNGQPVWFLPNKRTPFGPGVKDLKLSPFGTITFIDADKIYEVNYEGDILWVGPTLKMKNNVGSFKYHHEFTRLANGNYMSLGFEYLNFRMSKQQHTNSPAVFVNKAGPRNDKFDYVKVPFGTIIEYEKNGNLVWLWKSSDYFFKSDVFNYKPDGGLVPNMHENAFYFDEKNKVIYTSFKNIDRVIKIKYPGGAVLNTYGEKYRPGAGQKSGTGMFCGQHCCRRSQDGYLYLYNNNSCDSNTLPKILMIKEPTDDKGKPEKIWEYECTIEGVSTEEKRKYKFTSGGSVQELRDKSLFVCMDGSYSKVFIVNREQELLWAALSERWNAADHKWDMLCHYRAYMIDDQKNLERLIWNTN